MFGNFSAQAGVIASIQSLSPNIITPTVNWNFNDVLVMDFNPPGVENVNDRPRINIWRDVDGVPDYNYLKYVSGGKTVLSPAPTGKLIQPWGDRNTGTVTFPTTSILQNQITVGIDLFTHNFALPINISPPANQWIVNTTGVTGEIQYQYRFVVGPKNPVVNISLDYTQSCKPINIPNCPSNQVLVFVGTGAINGCPIFICEDPTLFIEQGSLYNNNTWINGPGIEFGTWNFNSGLNSIRNISNSNQHPGRQSIGNQSFFMVGPSGALSSSHIGLLSLNNKLSSGQSLSIDANYAYFGGIRDILFKTGNGANDYIYRIRHANSNALSFTRQQFNNFAIVNSTITGDAYSKAFTYKVINLGTGLLFEATQLNSSSVLLSNIITGLNIDFNIISGLSIEATLSNVPSVDWFNYGIYFNNITFISGIN